MFAATMDPNGAMIAAKMSDEPAVANSFALVATRMSP